MSPITKNGPRVIGFFHTRQLGIAWMIAVIMGALLISANPAINPQRLILPVVIMITYGLFIYNRSAALFAGASQAFQHTIVGQLADSMYFMGFVWTLWALIDSFVIHQLKQADAVFRTFGYALVTTAFGMFCRLLILQFKYTATEQSTEAQATVEDVLLKFGSTLEATREILNDWHNTLGTANEQIAHANGALITTIETTRHELTTTITTATMAYTTMLGTIQDRLEAHITKIGNDLASTLKEAIQNGIGDLGATTSQQFDEIKDATAALVTTFKRANTGLGKGIDDLTEKTKALTIETNNAAMQLVAASLAITKAAAYAGAEINKTATNLDTTATNFTTTMKANVDAITTATGKLANDMTGLADQVRSDITLGLTGITITPHVSLVVDETAIRDAISPVRQDLQQNTEQTKKVQQTIENKLPTTAATPDDIRNATAKIESLIVRIEGRIEQIQNDAKPHEHKGPLWGIFGRG
jgi:hypothetical protein